MKRLLLFLLLLSSVTANAGTEKGNGGEYIILNGVPRLVDLAVKDPAFCESRKLNQLIKELAPFQASMQELEKLHFSLAYSIQLQAKQLKVCFTPFELQKLEEPGETIPVKFKQLAVRIGESIFINKNIYKQLSQLDKSYLLIHEIMHSYFNEYLNNRKVHIRSMVQALRLVHLKTIDQHELARTISRTRMSFPEYSIELITEEQKKMAKNFKKIAREELGYCEKSKLAKEIDSYLIKLSSLDHEIFSKLATFNIEKLLPMLRADDAQSFISFINRCGWDINTAYSREDKPEILLLTSARYNAHKIFSQLLKQEAIEINQELADVSIFAKLTLLSGKTNFVLKLATTPKFDPNYRVESRTYHSTNVLIRAFRNIIETIDLVGVGEARPDELELALRLFDTLIENPKTDLDLLGKLLARPVLMDIIRFSAFEKYHDMAMRLTQKLLAKGAEINFGEGANLSLSMRSGLMPKVHSPLTYFIENERLNDLKFLKENSNLDINYSSKRRTPLHEAVQLALKGKHEILDYLLTFDELIRNPVVQGYGLNKPLLYLLIEDGDHAGIVKKLIQRNTIDLREKYCAYNRGKERCYTYRKWAKEYDRPGIRAYLNQIK